MRNIQIVSLLAAVCLSAATSAFGAADGIYPASTPEAVKAIHWSDSGYFVINGQPTFISSGEIHYARVPAGIVEGPDSPGQGDGA